MSDATLRDQLRHARERLFPRDGNALGCGKKVRYIDEPEARRALRRRMFGKINPETNQLYVYPCTECKGWHLTKLKPPK